MHSVFMNRSSWILLFSLKTPRASVSSGVSIMLLQHVCLGGRVTWERESNVYSTWIIIFMEYPGMQNLLTFWNFDMKRKMAFWSVTILPWLYKLFLFGAGYIYILFFAQAKMISQCWDGAYEVIPCLNVTKSGQPHGPPRRDAHSREK